MGGKGDVQGYQTQPTLHKVSCNVDNKIVLKNVKLLGYLPKTDRISQNISPQAIITGEVLNYKRHMAIPFGQYFQIQEEYNPRNSTKPRTRGAICMVPSRNNQGEFKFMTLGSMNKVTRRS